MAETFKFDVFLSHSSKDYSRVRKRAAGAGMRVWFDEWGIQTTPHACM